MPLTPYYQDDAVTIYCSDAREILPQLTSADLIFTDPPYGHNNNNGDLISRWEAALGRGDYVPERDNIPIANDGPEANELVCWLFAEAARLLPPGHCCCCCCGGGGPSPTFAWVAQRMDEQGLSFFHSVIWDKKNPGMGWRYRRQYEMVMIAHRRGGKLAWADPAVKQANIIGISKPRDDEHPNAKPLMLIQKFIHLHTVENQVVLDPFMGSGTTGVACAKMGRKFIGVEIERKYFDIACRRIEDAYRQRVLFAPGVPVMKQVPLGL